MALKRPEVASKWPDVTLKRPEVASKWQEVALKRPEVASKWLEVDPTWLKMDEQARKCTPDDPKMAGSALSMTGSVPK